MASKLAYWDIRGLAEPLRLLLTYAGEDFEDVRYKVGPAPEYSRESWFSVKFTLGLPFPNLPYYIDDDVKITQTNAIFRYLGRKHKLDGETTKEKTDCDVCLETVMDLRNAFMMLCYGSGSVENFNANREKYVKDSKTKLTALCNGLGDKQFLVGSKVTTCDFHLYEMLSQHQLFEPTILDDLPKLKDYMKRFEALPRIKEYLDAGKSKASAVNNPMAHFK